MNDKRLDASYLTRSHLPQKSTCLLISTSLTQVSSAQVSSTQVSPPPISVLTSALTSVLTSVLTLGAMFSSISIARAWSGALDGVIEVDAAQAQLIGSGTYEVGSRLSFIASCRLPGARRGVLQFELGDHDADGSRLTLPPQALRYTEFNSSGQSLMNGYASVGSASVTSTRSGAVIEVRLSAEVMSERNQRSLDNIEIKLINRGAAPEEVDPYDALIAEPDLNSESDDWFGCDGVDEDLIRQTSSYYNGEDGGYDVDLEYEGYYEETYSDPESSYQSEGLWGDDNDSGWFSDDSALDEYDDLESDESGCDSGDDSWESDEFAVEAAPRATQRARLRSPKVWHLVSRLIPVIFSLLLIRIWRRISV